MVYQDHQPRMEHDTQIAVIGMACRLPGGADNPESLWSLLAEGRDGRVEVPSDRWDWKAFYHPNPDMKEATNFSHAYFLAGRDVAAFDAHFFGISAAEATGLDPQQRQLLEVSYEAIENAGLPMEALRGSNTSVHMAMFARDYDRMGYQDGAQLRKAHVTGTGDAIIANRLSYFYDLRGPSNSLDTGCSGSLVALHQACSALKSGESTLALTGACQLLLTPDQSIVMSQLTNQDGRCYSFDDRGHGYSRGEGLGVLVLKRLDLARADGDNVQAIIVESGSNHDGRTPGILIPNADSQEALARQVYAKAGLDPRETLFVESHGTGTVVGDAAEITSISRVFGLEAGRTSVLPVGSIKANIGHLESASGVASVIKAIMVLKKDSIPAQLNYINPKPSLRLQARGIKIPLELTPLTPQGHLGPRRVSVNSFGYGGSNALCILEAEDLKVRHKGSSSVSPAGNTSDHAKDHKELRKNLLVLSASSEVSLKTVVANLQDWIRREQYRGSSFADLVYTLNERRAKLPWRCSTVAGSFQELETMLESSSIRRVKTASHVGVAFVFTGQGAQWYAMGRELLLTSQEFANSVSLCNEAMRDVGCDWDLVEELQLRDEATSQLGQSRFSQPATTAIQIALVDLLAAYGILPQAVCGHSSGEIAAAYAAGALSRELAMHIAYYRGVCSAQVKDLNAKDGAMLAVGEGEEAIQDRIDGLTGRHGQLAVACVNSPESTTVSGDLDAIVELQSVLDDSSVFHRRLKVDTAYHSHHMTAVEQQYHSYLSALGRDMPPGETVAFYSSVTGTRKQGEFDPSYWVSNLTSQVKFSAAAQAVAEYLVTTTTKTRSVIIEIGPHSALAGPLRQSLANFKSPSGASFGYTYVPSLVRNRSATQSILELAGLAFEQGVPVQLDAVTTSVLHGGAVDQDQNTRPKVIDTLPTYPWDHSTSFWHESRLSKGHRQRSFPVHDLVGLYDVHGSPAEPRWRYHVSLEVLPWLRDHVVEGFVIFPGAGYLTMVIEALKQLVHLRRTGRVIKHINFRNVAFVKPVTIHGDEKEGRVEVELQLTISPSRQHVGSPWEHFRIMSYDPQNDSWTDHCTGLASCDFKDVAEATSRANADSVMGIGEDDVLGHTTQNTARRILRSMETGCPVSVDPQGTYRDLAASGNAYGPRFQGLQEIRVGKNQGFAKVVVEDIAKEIPGHYMQPHTIHPTTFDSIFQLAAVVFRRECTTAPMMPVKIGELSIAADVDSHPGAEILVALHLHAEKRHEATTTFIGYQKQRDGTFRPVVTGVDLQPRAVGEAALDVASKHKTHYRMEWQADVDYLTPAGFMDHASRHGLFDIGLGTERTQSADEQGRLNDTVASIFIHRVVRRFQDGAFSAAISPHLSKLLSWMLKWDTSKSGHYLAGLTFQDETRLIDQARKDSIIGHTLSLLGPRYADILTGKVDSLELLLQADLLGRLYSEDILFRSHYAQIGDYMQAIVHKNPNLRMLEIGAGTGGATRPLMDKIEHNDRLLLNRYTYTDISSGFFERARTKFGKWASQMDFQTLDISRDSLSQGFAPHSFDLIVASNVLHATPLVAKTMAHIRKLLAPQGRLVLIELTAVTPAQNAVFGILEGWWMAQDGRQDGPLLTVLEWDAVLKGTGFDGASFAIPAHTGASRDASTLILAQATDMGETTRTTTTTDTDGRRRESDTVSGPKRVAWVYPGYTGEVNAAFEEALSVSLNQKGIACGSGGWRTNTTDNVPNATAGSLLIVIDSAEHPLLLNQSEAMFDKIKTLLVCGNDILWISIHDFQPTAETAALKNMVNGMARVVRRENPSVRLITVDVKDLTHPSRGIEWEKTIQALTKITMTSFWPDSRSSRTAEWEYAIQAGETRIPRVVPDDDFARFLDRHDPVADRGALVEWQYLNKDRPLMFDVQVPGLLNTIRFVDNEKMGLPLGADEVELQARAHGVNFKDVFIALGQMAPGTLMTGEVAGVVTAVGSNVQQWQPGARVACLMAAPFGNRVRVTSHSLVAIPDSMSFVDAASVVLAFYTAWYCIVHVARLAQGQTILIHAASGGVGQAAIQLAQRAGAEIFATIGSKEKGALLQDRYSIPADHIFSSQSTHFKQHILDATQGRGIDVVLNSLAGPMLTASWDCVAQFGTFFEIGKADIFGGSQLSMANFDKHITFASVDISHMCRLRPGFVAQGIREIFALVDEGALTPVYPVTTYPMGEIEQAFRLIAARKHMGKLVLIADQDTKVFATRAPPRPLRLHHNGTYIIGGGLGDLGLQIGLFLAEKGAGHIVALTRRHVGSEQRIALETRFSEQGATLHIVKCDIADAAAVDVAAEATSSLPPVRGVIQSALVLCDHHLEFMTAEDWMTAVKPKVHGTLNMHRAFCAPETTDFFVTLSSIASLVALKSQSNYSAGNAFQDAFAEAQRQSSAAGITHYASINVGAVEGSAQISRALAHNNKSMRSYGSVSLDELLVTIEYAIGAQGRGGGAAQCIMPIDRDSLEESGGPDVMRDHILDRVLSRREQGADQSKHGIADTSKRPSASQAIEQASTIAEAESIVNQALIDKFTAFIGDEVPDNQPVATFGLDSLVSIELKNWVKHVFQTPLQTSELTAARSITSLATLIVSRMMHLKCRDRTHTATGTDRDGEGPVERRTSPQRQMQSRPSPDHTAIGPPTRGLHGAPSEDCCGFSEAQLTQPLPNLDESLDLWLEANQHLYSPQQLAVIHQDFQTIRALGSPARKIMEDLDVKHQNDPSNGWYGELVAEARWLRSRAPLAPCGNAMMGHRDSRRSVHSQAERAAIIITAAVAFERAAAAGRVAPLEIAGRPDCTHRWGWLFHSIREPHIGCDKLVRYALKQTPARQHVAVMRKGYLFKLALQDRKGKDLSLDQLRREMDAIVALTEAREETWSGMLTTDERDSWAQIRQKLMTLSAANADYFHAVESAMFVLCLDTGSPTTPDEIARQGYIGDGANRWFDKSLQFFVSANGRSGHIAEHTAIDGTTPVRLMEWVAKAMDDYAPPAAHQPASTGAAITPPSREASASDAEELHLQRTPDIDQHIETLRKRYLAATAPVTYVKDSLAELGGTDALLRARVPVKGVIDLTVQLALRLFFGRNQPAWEPTSAAHFHGGRTDAVQRASPAVAAFCDAAAQRARAAEAMGPGEDKNHLLALLAATTAQLRDNVLAVLAGRSYLPAFEVLGHLWPADPADDVPARPRFLSAQFFFGRPQYPPVFAQCNAVEADLIFDHYVKAMADPDGFWAVLTPEKDTIGVYVIGGSAERTARLVKDLHCAARFMRQLVDL